MNEYYVKTIISLVSELILAILALWKFAKVLKEYRPLLVVSIISFFTDAFATAMAFTIRNNLPATNIYVLIELIFFLWLFDNWKTASRALLVSFLVIGIAVWSWEVFVYRSVWQFADVYRTVYSFFIVLLAVWQANKMFVQEKRALTKNATFLICIGFVFYYTIKCTVELLYQLNITFATYIWALLSYSNNILVCIYILAVLRMPEKKAFSLQATTQ